MNKDDIEVYGYAYFVKFLDYMKRNNFLHRTFRLKYFNPGDSYNCYGGYRPFSDIDMSVGCVRYALAFGHSHGYRVDVDDFNRCFDNGYIKKLSNSKRCLDLVRLRGDGFL